jgi:Na+/H+ antiporter NhaD/arsenite permease-like protein
MMGREGPPPAAAQGEPAFRLEGTINLLLLVGVVLSVLMSGVWHPGISFDVYHVHVELQNLLRDLLLLAIAGVSLWVTPAQTREANEFSWFPIIEVAKLFAGIFITIIPAIAILRAGSAGALAPIIDAVNRDGEPVDAMYFWATGILSSFLDNAPTYLVFFNTAGGDAEVLTGPLSSTLLAISAGAVFMGANTYIGNAPNFMVRAIAEERGVRMPSFFGYMVWSCVILMPLFVVLTWLFFI